MAPREGLEFALMKMGRTGPALEPRRRPQAGKSGDPYSQNADNIEVDELGAVVVVLSEGDKEADLPYRGSGAVCDS